MPDETPEQTIRANLGLAVLILHAAGHLDAATADRAFRSVVGSERDRKRNENALDVGECARILTGTPNTTPARV